MSPEPGRQISEVRWKPLAICLTVGTGLWLLPAPEGVSEQGWHVLAVFTATILGLLSRPLPMGALVLLGLVVLAGTGTLAPADAESEAIDYDAPLRGALAGYGDSTVWLVVAAFLLAGAVIGTGLGKRVALALVDLLGHSTLGLGYAIAGAELLLGPFVPSNTARGGGVMAPIVDSLSHVLEPKTGHQRRGPGEYLVLCGAHANLVAAAMFLTAMAANPLVATAARENLGVDFGWTTWLVGSIVPGLASMALLPLVLFVIARPQMGDAGAARAESRRLLKELGGWTFDECLTALVLAAMLALWMTKPQHHLPTTLVALGGVVALLIGGALRWRDVAENWAAWDALVWLGGLVTMAGALREYGVIEWLTTGIQNHIGALSGVAVALVLAVAYFYSMYGFSMLTGHILAMAGALMLLTQGAGAPPLLSVALIAYFSSLCGCLTNYSTGPMVIYFGLGRVPIGRWYYVGFLVSLLHMAVWLGLGLPYWKLLGWW